MAEEASEDGTFVNPYTFVPFPPSPPQRSTPTGHLGRPDLLSGRLTVNIRAETSLLIRGFERDGNVDVPRRNDGGDNGRGTPIIPGSSLKGALRSLHETLAVGCLRVFDGDFVPGYRDSTSSAHLKRLRMAIVHRHDDEKSPPQLLLCSAVDEEEARQLRIKNDRLASMHRAQEQGLRSGDRLNIDDNAKPIVAEDGEWVVFISDTNKAKTENKVYRAPIRRYPSDANPVEVPEKVWGEYLRAVEGTGDLRNARARGRKPDDSFAVVEHDGVEIGMRHLASRKLSEGQPVWVETNGDQICSVRLSMVWRYAGDFTAGKRIPRGFHPCRAWDDLCPSCQVFGSADTDGADTPEARQQSYKGHVRIGDALASKFKTTKLKFLAPLSSPRPGAGQFYLDNDEVRGDGGKPPLRTWGSEADPSRNPRHLRGRKYYWHTPPAPGASQSRRAKARDHQVKSNLVDEVVLLEGRKSEFTATITFSDLNEVQLGGLLAALQPSDLLGKPAWQHIGGGRPLGFGSCTLRVDPANSEIWRTGSRYGAAGDAVTLDVPGLIERFRAWMLQNDPAIQRYWKDQVAKVLLKDAVNAEKVWYPPGANWGDRGKEKFDQGHEFWKETSGERTSRDGRPKQGYPLTPLPQLSDDQEMKIVEGKAQKRNLPAKDDVVPDLPKRPNT